jgi:hypothetical protein
MTVGYLAESVLRVGPDESQLALETALGAGPEGLIEHPRFFDGFLARPEVVAAGLLAVADVAATRYFDLAAVRARFLDPVVTASGDRLRFESFSACNGVYARLDLLADGIDSGEIAFGTTNVDINQPLRSALAGLGASSLVHLGVGADSLRVSTPEESHQERKVEMPDRWIRGFGETPVIAARMEQRAELLAGAIGAFVASLPRGAPGPSYYVVLSPVGLRQSARQVPGAVHLAGTARLSAAARVARFARKLKVYGDDAGASAWSFELPGAVLTLQLSPEPYRGFSGEGGLLTSLTTAHADQAARILEHLAWEPLVDHAALADSTGLTPAAIISGLSFLAASGKIGFDLAENDWFHRELPFDANRAELQNPRLVAAKALAAAGHVHVDGTGWRVHVEDHDHWVRTGPAGQTCTCLWWTKHQNHRGPCKHILAVAITSTP